jgi:hypothetical protein
MSTTINSKRMFKLITVTLVLAAIIGVYYYLNFRQSQESQNLTQTTGEKKMTELNRRGIIGRS